MQNLRVALAQMNPAVGDFDGNRDKIIQYIDRAGEQGADIVAFPELAISGYPPEDLVLRTGFINRNLEILDQVAAASRDIAVVIGFIERHNLVYNSAAFIYDKRIYGAYRKVFLPNYGVFDEKRYFSPGESAPVFEYGDIVLGVNICEDVWYPNGPAVMQAVAGAGIILNLNASPYRMGINKFRERMISTRASDNASYMVYVNCVGGQDELVFDGASMVFDPNGELIARGKFFEEDLVIVDLETESPFRTRLHDLRVRERMGLRDDRPHVPRFKIPVSPVTRKPKLPVVPVITPSPSIEGEVYDALVTGVRDYILKNGFKQALIGLSGGIDSALVTALAVDALGAENIQALFMPSRYSSDESREDAALLAENLGIKLHNVPIENIFKTYLDELAPFFGDLPQDNTEQNIQARIRGNLLMAFSNKFGSLVLTTGNKSEMAVGYATIYGDMAGGFAAIKDIPKTMVYDLCHYRNSLGKAIPERILTKAPSAELKDNQKDSDNLPPYEVLDPILKGLIEEDREIIDVAASGFDEAMVRKVARMIHVSEYKRRQAPPGIKITQRAFGRDRRIPITNGFVV